MSTLTTLEANVLGALGSNTTDLGSNVIGWLNDAVVDMLKRTHCYVTTATETLTANQSDYTPAASILAIEEIYVTSGGQGYRLQPRPARSVIDMRLNSSAASPPRFYAQLGASLLTLYPTPSAADTLTIYYVPVPTAMSSGTHDPSNATYGGIPAQFHPGLELYAQWKGGAFLRHQTSAQGERWKREYLGDPSAPRNTAAGMGFIGEMQRDISRMGGRPLGYFVVPAQDAVGVAVHDPSQDIR